jgi:ribosomal protein S27AE
MDVTSPYDEVIITAKCLECGEDLLYDRHSQRYVCRNCGLTMTREEYSSIAKKRVGRPEEGNSWKREYLKWWLSKKD